MAHKLVQKNSIATIDFVLYHFYHLCSKMTMDIKDSDPAATTPLAPDAENQFNDESPEDGTGNAAFANDTGNGTAALMKPRKPITHVRGGHYSIQGGKLDLYDESLNEFQASKWHIVSELVFTISSILYLTMPLFILPKYEAYRGIPSYVMTADDDATWWNYLLNCTDGPPENVTNADDDYAWYEWYNETLPVEDDVVFTVGENEPAWSTENDVTTYQILYFWAAFGFLITGVIQVVLARRGPFIFRALYYLMMLAAMFGVVSAIIMNKDPMWSNITNCVSVNLWALEALAIIAQRLNLGGMVDESTDVLSIGGIDIKVWIWISDISFMLGTFGDAIVSWFYLFGWDVWGFNIAEIVFAAGWLITALIYLMIAIFDYNQFKSYVGLIEQYEQDVKELKGKQVAVEKGGPDNDNGPPVKDSTKATDTNEVTETSPDASINSSAQEEKKNDSDNNKPAEAQEGDIPRSSTADVADDSCCAIPGASS